DIAPSTPAPFPATHGDTATPVVDGLFELDASTRTRPVMANAPPPAPSATASAPKVRALSCESSRLRGQFWCEGQTSSMCLIESWRRTAVIAAPARAR